MTISIQLSNYPGDLKVVDFEGFEKCACAFSAHNSKETKPVI